MQKQLTKTEAYERIAELLEDYNGYYSDLHYEVFNTDYYIIGTYKAEKALEAYGVFDAIEKVQEYERFNFGKLYTDITNPEQLANMLFYVIGGECLLNIETFSEHYGELASDEVNAEIIAEIKERFL